MYCSKCGSKIPDGSKFCGSCGARVITPLQSGTAAVKPKINGQTVDEWNRNESSTDKPEKKKKKHGCLRTLVVLLLIGALIYTGFISPAFVSTLAKKLKPLPDCFENGTEVTAEASSAENTTIGSADTTGYTVTLPAGSLPDGANVTMRVLSADETKKYGSNGMFDGVGTLVELTSDKYDGGLFENDVTVTVKIPEKQLGENVSAGEYAFMYYNEAAGEWTAFDIDCYDPEAGTITGTLPHFSDWWFGRLSKDEQIDRFATKYCMQAVAAEHDSQAAAEALVPYIGDSLKNLDLPETERNDLVRSVAIYVASRFNTDTNDAPEVSAKLTAAAWKAYEGKDPSEFVNTVGDTVAEKLTDYLLKSGKYVPEYAPGITKAVGNASSLSRAAGYASEGDYEDALREVGSIMAGWTPSTALINAAANYAVKKAGESYDNWKANQIEELYGIYKNGARDFWGSEVSPQNEEELWEYIYYPHGYTRTAGIYRIYSLDSIKQTCARYGWSETDYKQLSPEKKAIFDDRAKENLMNYFRTRLAQEKEADEMKKEEIKFIRELERKTNVLSSFKFSKFFGEGSSRDFDLNKRLAKVYETRGLISVFVDQKKYETEGPSEYRLVEKWVELFDKYDEDTALPMFLKYLKENKILNDQFDDGVSEVSELDEIVGYWNFNIRISNISSEFSDKLESILGDAVEKHYDENTVYNIFYAVEIKPLDGDKIEAGFYCESEDGTYTYNIYKGTYKDGVMSLKFSKESGTGNDLPLKKIELEFSKNSGAYTCTGEEEYGSFLYSCTYTFTGKWTDTLE